MNEPLITVLMPAFNPGRHFRESVASVLAQSFRDFELLIVDDGSTDHSIEECVDQFRDSRIRVLRNEANRGLVWSLNRGLEQARGSWIARQDADDISVPNRLQEQLAFVRAHPAIHLLGSDAWLVDEGGRSKGRWRTGGHADLVAWDLCFRTPFCHSSAFFRRQSVVAKGGYRELVACEDYDLWSRIAVDGAVVTLRAPLVKYRLHDRSIMAGVKGERVQRAADDLKTAMRAYLGRVCPGVDEAVIETLTSTWTGDEPEQWSHYFEAASDVRNSFLRGRRPPAGFARICADQIYMLWNRVRDRRGLLSALKRAWPEVWWKMPWLRMAAATFVR